MIFTLLFAAASALVGLVLFNSGMLANVKTRLQNAGDAGAYSAAVLQARDHNFSAYLNRAMVANQVAVVQLASLKSYIEDAANTHRRMGETELSMESSMIPLDKPMWEAADDLPIESSVASAYNNAAGPAVQGLDLLIQAFQVAQDAHHVATTIEMAAVADEVVKRNDVDAQVSKSAFSLGTTTFEVKRWSDSTKSHRANDNSAEADRFADVVVSEDSTDAFTRNRFSVPLPNWGPTEVKVCMAFPNYVSSWTIFGFAHAGGSILSQDKKRWLALDATWGTGTQSCTFWYPCPFLGICYTTETTPLIDGNFGRGDSGGAVIGKNGDYDSRTGYKNNPSTTSNYGYALINPATIIPATIRYNSTGPGPSLDTAGGLQEYYRDVANPTSDIPANQSAEENGGKFAVTIEVERKGDSIRTSNKVLPDSDKLRLDPSLRGDTMRALSSAHAYFYRSKTNSGFNRSGWARDDDKTELANLFNPYWQSRLVDRTLQERTASWAAQ